MGYKYIFFDLDGTLTESAPGITRSAAFALKKYGVDANPSELTKFVGPPLAESFRKYYGMSEQRAAVAVEDYREYYVSRGMFENGVYDGVEDMLARLKNAGKTLFVATSKPEIYCKKILSHYGLSKYFSRVFGSTLTEERTKKEEVLGCALASLGLTDKSEALMVGDRSYDVEGARKVGVVAMGVLYGYGSEDEFSKAGYVAKTPWDVACIILSFG